MPDAEDEPVISYSVREILARLEGKLDSALAAIHLKADNADLLLLGQRIGKAEERLGRIEDARESERSRVTWWSEWRRWLAPLVVSAVMAAAMIYSLLQGTGGGTHG